MAGIAHLGVGLAFSLLLPDVPIIFLVICSYLLDLLFIVFMLAGVEDMPSSDRVTEAAWSHSLLMAIFWSVAVALIGGFIGLTLYSSLFIGLLVLSHWIIDYIVSPMTYTFPNDTGKMLHPFGNSPKVGLGVMSTKLGVLAIEGGSLLVGGFLFISTIL